jgi:hypothetical protein
MRLPAFSSGCGEALVPIYHLENFNALANASAG